MEQRRINIGCGPDILKGWVNTDYAWPGTEPWDIRSKATLWDDNYFDIALVNHTFTLLTYDEVETALVNIREILKSGGKIQVIDFDAIKAIDNLASINFAGFPGFEGSIQERYCKHLVGYGRKSLWTPSNMAEALKRAGFKNIEFLQKSVYDLRPQESFVVEATK